MKTNLLPQVEEKIITLRNQQVILDCDVAELYGVETKRINEAVNNNPEKFPDGYIFELENKEVISLRSKISTLKSNGRDNTQSIFLKLSLKKVSICWRQF